MDRELRDCVIFSAGVNGQSVLCKVDKVLWNVVAFADNDVKKQGTTFENLKVISAEETAKMEDTDIIAAGKYAKEIRNQLIQLGVSPERIYIQDEQTKMIMKCSADTMGRFYLDIPRYERKLKKILFVQDTACVRTLKIAKAFSNNGIECDLAFSYLSPDINKNAYNDAFSNVWPIHSFSSFIDFLNSSDYDIVHCSNEPDVLTNIALCSDKKIVHDTHDFNTLRFKCSDAVQTLEFIANTKAWANLYPSEGLADYAVNKYNTDREKIFVLENLPLEENGPKMYHEKLSLKDNEIHCVYAGGINPVLPYRNYENIWKTFASQNIHIHFYTNYKDTEYCKYIESLNPQYIHYEGHVADNERGTEITKYDIGFMLFDHFEGFEDYFQMLNTCSPNKMREYLLSGLPVAANLPNYVDFLKKYNVGGFVDIHSDLKSQLEEIMKLKVDKKLLSDNRLTIDSKAKELIEFYEKRLRG